MGKSPVAGVQLALVGGLGAAIGFLVHDFIEVTRQPTERPTATRTEGDSPLITNDQVAATDRVCPSADKPIAALCDAARAGSTKAQFALGTLHAKGSEGAFNYMRQSAEGGLAIAQGRLGEFYEHGTGVAPSEAAAARWYQRGAEGGHIQAMHNIGYYYAAAMGGIAKDAIKAEYWFRKAAEHGLLASQVNLAIVLFDTKNFPEAGDTDPSERLAEAYFWAARAAIGGDSDSERLRDIIAQVAGYTAEERARLDTAVESWRAKPFNAIANGGFDMSGQMFLSARDRSPLGDAEIAESHSMLEGLGYLAPGVRTPPATATAIRQFQADYGLQLTGEHDWDLLAALRVASLQNFEKQPLTARTLL